MIALAGCILRNETGEILLLHRNTLGRVQWELPGGKLDAGESSEDAARREVLEEVGVMLGELVPFAETTFGEGAFVFHHHSFTAQIVKGTPEPLEVKFDEVRYVPVTALESLPLSQGMKSLLPYLHAAYVPVSR